MDYRLHDLYSKIEWFPDFSVRGHFWCSKMLAGIVKSYGDVLASARTSQPGGGREGANGTLQSAFVISDKVGLGAHFLVFKTYSSAGLAGIFQGLAGMFVPAVSSLGIPATMHCPTKNKYSCLCFGQ